MLDLTNPEGKRLLIVKAHVVAVAPTNAGGCFVWAAGHDDPFQVTEDIRQVAGHFGHLLA